MDGPEITNFAEYQHASAKTAVFPKEKALEYLTLGLVGEAGEIANKVKKIIRDDNGELTWEKKKEIVDECGDVLWYLSQILDSLDVSLRGTAQRNLDKLYSRKKRGTLKGSGDNR